MALTIYGANISPFVRKVLWYVQEQQLSYTHKVIMPFGLEPDWYREISPLSKIPAIKDGDFNLADSAVICAYLNNQYPRDTSLYPKDAKALAQVQWLEQYADEELAAVATFGLFANKAVAPLMGKPVDEARVAAALHKLPTLLDYLAQTLGKASFFVGDTFSMADIAIGTHWLSLSYANVDIDAQRWPTLAAHAERLRQRPVLQALLAQEQAILQKMGVGAA